MRWKIKASPEAMKDFYSLPTDVRTRIREKLRVVRTKNVPSLHHMHPYGGWYSIRIGKYRVIYTLVAGEPEIKEIYYGYMVIFGVCLRKCLNRILKERYKSYG